MVNYGRTARIKRNIWLEVFSKSEYQVSMQYEGLHCRKRGAEPVMADPRHGSCFEIDEINYLQNGRYQSYPMSTIAHIVCDNRDGWLVAWGLCYTENAPNALPRNTKDKKHLQSTQSAQPTNLTDRAPSTTERVLPKGCTWCLCGCMLGCFSIGWLLPFTLL